MKKIVLILVLVLLIAGGVGGYLVFSGKVYVKGISPKKIVPQLDSKSLKGGFVDTWTGKAIPRIDTATADLKKKAAAVKPPEKKVEIKMNDEKGEKKLAALWESIDTEKLVKITEKWPPNDLAKILVRMDEETVSKYLAALEPTKAAMLSTAIRTRAATPPPDSAAKV